MNYLLRYTSLVLSALIVCLGVNYGQQGIAHSSPNGIIVFTGYDFHYQGEIEIAKAVGKKKLKPVATLARVRDRATFNINLDKYQVLLPYLPAVPFEIRDSLWERSQDISQTLSYNPNTTLYYLSLGIAYFDKDVESGETYTYGVRYSTPQGEVSYESAPVVFGASPELPVARYEGAQYEGQSVRTHWKSLMSPTLHSFAVFRQDNERGDFVRAICPMIYSRTGSDTLLINCFDTTAFQHQTYRYIVRAVDLFSNLGPTSDTVSINTFYYGDMPYLKRFRAANTGENRQLRISWDFDNKPYLRSIVIERSREFDRDFKQIAEVSPYDTVYYDYVDEAHENYYYRLRWTGPDSVSVPTVVAAGFYQGSEVADSIQDLTATTIDDGVKLEWTDFQPFVLGYIIYRRQGGSGDFVQLVEQYPFDSVGYQSFIDTSEELSGNLLYEYYVQVVNDNYLLSRPSDTVQARPGVKRVLRAPTGIRARKHEMTAFLMWDDMRLFEPDVLGYELYRMMLGEDTLRLYGDLINGESNHFRDDDIVAGAGYGYAIKSIDRYGNSSPLSDTLFVVFPLTGPLPPAGVKVFVMDDGVEIRWDEFYGRDDIKYKVYRSVNGQDAEEIALLGSTFDRCRDTDVSVGQELVYYVTVVSNEGLESVPGEKVIVLIEPNK